MPEAIGAALIAVVPELGAAVFGSVTLGSILGYGVTTVGVLAAEYGVGYLAKSLAGTPGATAAGSAVLAADGQVNVRQAIMARRRSYGRVLVGGVVAYENAKLISSPSRGLWVWLLQGQGEIDAIEQHWLADEVVTVQDSDGQVITGTVATYCYIFKSLGTASQAAPAELVSAFPGQFTTDHRCRSVPWVVVKYVGPSTSADQQKYFPYGPPPYRALQRAALVYDPREGGQTANGSPDDPRSANWTWSRNAALIILDYLRHPDGWSRRTSRAMVPIAQFRAADWTAFANLCDEAVTLKAGGSTPRYQLNGTYEMTSSPKDVLQGMLDACDAELYRHGDGTIGIRGGAWTAPSVTITNNDLLSYSLRSGQRKASSCNIVRARYVSSANEYQSVDMDPWLDQTNIDLRGEELAVSLDLGWIANHSQARRIAKIQAAKRNPDWLGTIITGPRGLLCFNERTITLQITELGINQSFLVTSFEPSSDLSRVQIGVAALDSSAYSWTASTEEGTAPAISSIVGEIGDNDVYTKILLHMNGSNGGTTFADDNAGGASHTWTPTNAVTTTASKKFGTASMRATAGFISTPAAADFNLGMQDWTIDFCFNRNGNNGERGLFGQGDGTPAGDSILASFDASNIGRFAISNGASYIPLNFDVAITDSNWHHCAIERGGNFVGLWLDGRETSASAFSASIPASSNDFIIGKRGSVAGVAAYSGDIDEFRFSLGITRWNTGIFTPPAAEYA
jgi:hypothetical protein